MGSLVRGYRVDSGTFLDFISLPGPTQVLPPDPPYQGPPVAPSPSVVNPEMSRVTGFFFGSPNNGPGDPGVPFATPPVVAPGTTAGTVSGFNSTANAVTATVSVSGTGLVAWIEFGDHPYSSARRQADPIFDPIIPNGQLNVQTTLRGRDPFLGHEPFPAPTPVALGEMFRLTRPDPLAPGILTIDMGPMEQVDLGFRLFRPGPTAASQRVRIERVLSDQTTDGTASGTGNLTQVQIDILPSEGDIWCELIIYDGNGFSYRAKVRNWPPNPFNCTTPTLGLGSNAPGNLDIIALCFDAQAALYCLPSFSTSNPTGSGPFFGLVPDPTTFTYLSLPFGSHPAFVQTTVDGLYFLSITDPGLTGFTFDMVSIQWGGANLTGSGFTQFSNVATIVVQ
jgi:hypothetical protein